MKKNEMTKDVNDALCISLNPYIKKLTQASEKFGRLTELLDPILDKPFDENNPKYACGDVLEEIKEAIADTAYQMEATRELITAKVAAWENYPTERIFDDGQMSERCRSAFVNGYMNKFYHKD